MWLESGYSIARRSSSTKAALAAMLAARADEDVGARATTASVTQLLWVGKVLSLNVQSEIRFFM